MAIVAPSSPRHVVAAAIANARGGRRGAPEIRNILDILPAKLREEVLDDADAVIDALRMADVRDLRRWLETGCGNG